jgi:hypothetical protein
VSVLQVSQLSFRDEGERTTGVGKNARGSEKDSEEGTKVGWTRPVEAGEASVPAQIVADLFSSLRVDMYKS